ncbi:MAG TPA: alpha/beta hydrolase domain-containing protein, partial [Bryobacteraceae bacterium]|nr:alpha/beta hydrolase domain-containing protein [Bryobacteraceae bacterium]
TDPVTGVTDGILRKAQEQGAVPKIFYTNGSYEYWGRAASLIHTNLEGTQDAKLAPDTRIYLLAGTQHGPGRFPPTKTKAQNTANPADYRPLMRALLVSFQEWLKDGVEPPASEYPLIAKGQLVAVDKLRFPRLAGVEVPKHIQQAYRADYGEEFRSAGIVTKEPPEINGKYMVLVPQVDEGGNEISGIRLPEITVPVASYTGWNLRDPKIGAEDKIYSMVGSFLPFARTKAEREQTNDPRPSIAERYNGRDQYLLRVKAAAGDLVKKRFLLERDVPMLMERAQSLFEFK